jgi:hypothetical protein
MRARMQVQLGDTGTASNTKRWGVVYGATMPTVTDGAWFQTAGTTFGVVTMLATSPSVVTSFNGAYGTSFVLDANIHTYEIFYNNTKVYFLIDGKLLHTVTTTTSPWNATMNHYLFMDNVNSGNTVAKTITARALSIYRLGKLETAPAWKNINTTAVTASILKRGPGRLKRVIIGSTVNSTVVSLYDALSATNPIIIVSPPNGATPFALDFELDFYTGLCLTTTPNSANVTIVYE